jgi:glycosyl-4,4'-diaponeurosporenoate acyltransferase
MNAIFPLIEVAPWLMLTLNILIWPIAHIAISRYTLKLPEKNFQQDNWLYRLRRFETINFFVKVLKIRVWKKVIPDGATIFNEGFKKKKLLGTQKDYLTLFILETRRAEYSHLLQIFPAVIFFIFNSFFVSMIMVVYALAFNVPLIILQRYNRLRFLTLLKKL